MTSELKAATVFGSGNQIQASGQSLHLLETLQRRVHLETFADCGCPCIADAVAVKAAGRRYGSDDVRIESRYRLRERKSNPL